MKKRKHRVMQTTMLLAIWCICSQGLQFETAVAGEGGSEAATLSPRGVTLNDSRVTFRWAVRSPDVKGLRTDLESQHADLMSEVEPFKPSPAEREEYTDASFAPLMVVGGAVALSVVAEAVLKFYRGYQHGGAIIDTRGKNLEIRELPSLPPGSILVLNNDGTSTLFDAKSGIDVSALVNAISPALK